MISSGARVTKPALALWTREIMLRSLVVHELPNLHWHCGREIVLWSLVSVGVLQSVMLLRWGKRNAVSAKNKLSLEL